MNNLRSSQLLEEPVFIPLTRRQQRLIAQLDFFKKWYLLCHGGYILTLTLLASIVLFILEPDVLYIDAFFIATSTVTNCGLKTVDVAQWNKWSTLARHVFIPLGGAVVTSSFQPLLRLVMLYRVRDVFAPTPTDNEGQRRLRHTKSKLFSRLFRTSFICAVTPILYLVVVCTSAFTVLLYFNYSDLDARDCAYLIVSAFHGCIFSSMEPYAGDALVVGVTTVTSTLGFTAFPIFLRFFFAVEMVVMQMCVRTCELCHRFLAHRRASMSTSAVSYSIVIAEVNDDADNDEASYSSDEGRSLLVRHSSFERGAELSTFSLLCPINMGGHHAFLDILAATHPSTFHAFLFTKHETIYLAAAWVLITMAQFVPFLYNTRLDILTGYSRPYRLFLFACQASSVRFAAASFICIDNYSTSHIVLTLLAMFLPPLPISTDRTYRKWKQMFRTSIVRLLTSRLFWLFVALFCIIALEDDASGALLLHRRFDIVTCTLFEVISAYAGCGLSLSPPNSPVSFVGHCGTLSKIILTGVLLGGRHRFVDLGIDLGFAELQSDVRDNDEERLDQSDTSV